MITNFKKYKLINETYRCIGNYNNNLDGLKFSIIMGDTNKVIDEFKKFFDIEQNVLYGLKYKSILYVEIYDPSIWTVNPNCTVTSLNRNSMILKFDEPFFTTNIVQASEFLEIGLEKLKEYFELKNNTRKFNL